MNQHKRKLSYNHVPNEGIKKLQYELDQKIISITSIENLSNEFFYEIFDYLDGHEIYQAFNNLNHRFQQLLNSSSLLFRIEIRCFGDDFMNNCQQLIHLNRHQIFSINLELSFRMNEIFLQFNIDSSLNRLESIVLSHMIPRIFWPFLLKLSYLPRLFSLTIHMDGNVTNLTEIYQKILALPVLKYYKCSITSSTASAFLPIATDKQFSSIEYLVINHYCNFEQLAAIISYTPKIFRLSFTYYNLENNKIIFPMILINLTHLSLCLSEMKFDEFELLINEIYSKLKFLSFTTQSEDIDYLNGNRWEKLILKKFPQLEKFYFTYYESIDHANRSPEYSDKPNQFISSFWTERKWLFKVEINDDNIIFLIHPYKYIQEDLIVYNKLFFFLCTRQWYDYNTEHKIVNSSTQFSKSSLLVIPFIINDEYLITNITRILTLAQIYHFEISEEEVFIGILIHITNLLRELNSLEIHSLSSRRSKHINAEEFVPIYSTSNTSKITKVYLHEMYEIEDFYILLNLCPYMEYLEVDYLSDIDIEVLLQIILKKINRSHNKHLRSLCFHALHFDDDDDYDTGDEMMKKLENIINSKELLMNYTIKRVVDNIYLEWK